MMIYNSRWYQYFFCGIAIYICIAPLFILEDPRDLWQVSHFTDVEMLCLLQLLDPILVLVFIGTLILKLRPKKTNERNFLQPRNSDFNYFGCILMVIR